jgi:N-acetylneuraminate lyase
MKNKIGIIAATFAPFNPDFTINTDLIPDYCLFLERNNVEGVFINGTTGEGPSLTQRERQILTTAWTECSGKSGKMKVINLVGGTSYMECIENAVFSKEAGVDAIAVIGPYFYKPSEPGQLAEFVALIGESVPELPLYYYHIPSITGVSVPMTDFLKEVTRILPSFAGIKYSHDDWIEFRKCLGYDGGKYDIFCGRDEEMLQALSAGAKRFVGSTYNYAAPLYHSLIDAFMSGDNDRVKEYQQKSALIVSLLDKYGISAGKAFMKKTGIMCGSYRLPVRNLTDNEFNEFSLELTRLGLGIWLSK